MSKARFEVLAMTPADPTTSALDPQMAPVIPTDLLAEPTYEECHAEWIQYHEDHKAGRLPMQDLPEGHHLAYFGGRIVDHDPDMTILRERAATSLGIHPARLVISYPWMW
jgi:hypothetical protein